VTPNPAIDPIAYYCHEYNNKVWEDPYCEDYKDQTETEQLQELLIEIRENEYGHMLRTGGGKNIVAVLDTFMNSCQYLRDLGNPLCVHHLLALWLLLDTDLIYEYSNNTFFEGVLDTKWKHLFCTVTEAVQVLSSSDPLVGEHVHCSMQNLWEIDESVAIENIIVATKNRQVAQNRFPNAERTILDIYIPHRHYQTNDASVCASVADMSWLSRFTSEELVIIIPGQCLIVESLEKDVQENSVCCHIRGNNNLRTGKVHTAEYFEEFTINFGANLNITE